MIRVLIILFLLQSCAFNIGPKIEQMNFESTPLVGSFSSVTVNSKPTITKSFETKSCVNIYSFIPDRLKADLRELYNKACDDGEYIINAQMEDTFYWIPMFYGKECYVLRGQCAKD